LITQYELFWNIGDVQTVAHWLFIVALLVCFAGLSYHVFQWLQGRTGPPAQNPFGRAAALIHITFSHRTIMKDRLAGIIHLFIFWGFIVLFIGHIPIFFHCDWLQDIFGPEISEIYFPAFVQAAMDFAGLLLISGVLLGAYRRYRSRQPESPVRFGNVFSSALLLAIPLAGLMLKSTRLSVDNPPDGIWSPAGTSLGFLFRAFLSETSRLDIHRAFWQVHLGLAFVLIAFFSFTKLIHIFSSPLNIFYRAQKEKSALAPMEFGIERYGAKRVDDFKKGTLLSLDACTECTRCRNACPAHLSEKPLNPMELILKLRKRMRRNLFAFRGKSTQLVGNSVAAEEIWACTTCLACADQCPVWVNPMEILLEIRRNLVLEDACAPQEIERVYRNLEWFGDPLGMGKMYRKDLPAALNVHTGMRGEGSDFIFWIGCQGYLHERNKKTIQSILSLFQKLRLNILILGKDECCCGDIARRTGNEYLFRKMAEDNIRLFRRLGIKRIVTHCPHCLNVFKNEYPQLGDDLEVLHYTEIIKEALGRESPAIHSDALRKVTVHDPCYLSRYNGMADEIRNLLRRIPALEIVECKRSKRDTFCCGAGGGGMWIGRQSGRKINEIRAEEIRQTQADYLVTACPYCLTMMEEGLKNLPGRKFMQVTDFAEIYDQVLQ